MSEAFKEVVWRFTADRLDPHQADVGHMMGDDGIDG